MEAMISENSALRKRADSYSSQVELQDKVINKLQYDIEIGNIRSIKKSFADSTKINTIGTLNTMSEFKQASEPGIMTNMVRKNYAQEQNKYWQERFDNNYSQP
jgi:hypothetical protein